MIFSYKNDTISQEVKIEFLNKKSLHFDFTIENGKRNRTKEIQGIAQLPDGIQDVGTNTDENGIDYFVRTFSYEKDGCTIDIDIDSDTKDKLQVMETNCLTSHDKFCPFASVGILRLKK